MNRVDNHTTHVRLGQARPGAAPSPEPPAAVASPAVAKVSGEPGFPRRFGTYELLASIGRGGMGDVCLARRRGPASIDQLCVLKQVRTDTTDKDDYARRFLDEARVMAQLSHTNVCHVLEVGEANDALFLALEHIQGMTLDELLAKLPRALPVPLALFILSEALEGLDYAHRHKHPHTGASLPVVHRDVSPNNVMVSFEGEVKLIDFGLATSALKVERTEKDYVMGKIAYMSPEQARGDAVDARTDQYAAAIMATELFLHERFYGERPRHVVWGLCGTGTHRPQRFSEIPAALREVLDRALAARPDDRFPDCRSFKAALLEAGAHVAVSRDPRSALRDFLAETCGAERDAMLAKVRDAVSRAVLDEVVSEADRATEMSPAAPAESTQKTVPVEPTAALLLELARPRRQRILLSLALASLAALVGAAVATVSGDEEPKGAPAVEAAAEAPADVKAGTAAPTTVQIRVASQPAGALVFRDGAATPLGVTPFQLAVSRQTEPLSLKATLAGHESKALEVVPDGDRDVFLQLLPTEPASAAAAPAPERTRARAAPSRRPPQQAPRPDAKSGDRKPSLDRDAVVDPF